MNKTDNIHTARCYASCTTYLASEAQPGTQFGGGKPLDSGLRRNDEWSSPRRRPGSSIAVAKPLDSGLRRNDDAALSPILSRAREREKGGRNDEVNLRHQPATAPAYHRRLSCLPG